MLSSGNGEEETCIDFSPSSISIARKEYVLAIGKTAASEQHLRMQLRNLEQERALQEMKTNFISMTSHEFRTPLTAIASAVDLLETRIRMDRMMNAFYRQNIAKISDEIFNLNTMLDEILTLSKIVSNNYAVNKTPVDVAQVVEYLAFQYFSERKDERKLEVKVTGEPRRIPADKEQLSKILTNLIGNAFKYSTHENPQLKLHYHARKLVISVSDSGIGIPQKDIPHLFNTFYRGSNVDGIDGTGLGLAIVKTFTEMNGGEVKVTSEKGKGTKFTLTFRYA
jgi:signal transduction histidine kinase